MQITFQAIICHHNGQLFPNCIIYSLQSEKHAKNYIVRNQRMQICTNLMQAEKHDDELMNCGAAVDAVSQQLRMFINRPLVLLSSQVLGFSGVHFLTDGVIKKLDMAHSGEKRKLEDEQGELNRELETGGVGRAEELMKIGIRDSDADGSRSIKLIKSEVESNDSSNSQWENEGLFERSEKGSEEEEEERTTSADLEGSVKDIKTCGGEKRKSREPRKGRGRSKQPRRLNVPEGEGDDYTSGEGDGDEVKPVEKVGSGYPVEFKLRVLKYADTHSNSATAEKFGMQAKNIREWKKSRQKIEEDSRKGLQRHRRTDGITVEQKLEAVAIATERSIDEARLMFGVDRNTIGRWKAKKAQLEARKARGEGNSIREAGSGLKPRYPQIEEALGEWLTAEKLKGDTVPYKMILGKAKELMEGDPSTRGKPVPRTWSWVMGFLKRQNLREHPGDTHGQEETPLSKSKREPIKKIVLKVEKRTNTEEEGQSLDEIKQEIDSEEYETSSADNADNLSVSWKGSSDEEKEEREAITITSTINKQSKAKTPRTVKKKRPSSTKPKRSRPGRPKQPRRLNLPEGVAAYTSDEDDDDNSNTKPLLKPGSGYPVEFKLKVIKYAETHSTSATAEKFGLQPVRVRDWKNSRDRIEEESKGCLERRPRTDGFTIEEKLQAVEFAMEHSIGEAKLIYNVDRNTIGKWKAQKEKLEAQLLQGKGNSLRMSGSGCKPKYTPIEDSLRDWIVALRLKGVTLNYKMILRKAQALKEEIPTMHDLPAPKTWSWVTSFLKRHNLEGLLGNILGHEDPLELLNLELKTAEANVEKLADEIPENPNKRNRRTITLEDKVNIIRRIEHGETQGQVAKSLRVATSTIQTIWSSRNEILRKFVNPKSATKSDALLWKTYNVIGITLKDWLDQNNSQTINRCILMEKALQLAETYKVAEFPSEAKSWLRIFCKRHKLMDTMVGWKNSNAAGTRADFSSMPHDNLLAGDTSANSVDSTDLPDDDFHSDDFKCPNDDLPTIQQCNLPLQSQKLSAQPTPFASSLSSVQISTVNFDNYDHRKFTLPSGTVPQSRIATSDAIKCYRLLRTWIHENYGSHESILSSRLSGLEHTILKRPENDMEQN